jgi:hypothetical protein
VRCEHGHDLKCSFNIGVYHAHLLEVRSQTMFRGPMETLKSIFVANEELTE